MNQTRRCLAIKATVRDPDATVFVFEAEKTMYGGKDADAGDLIFIFASENDGGKGLIARGVVTECERIPRTAAIRQTPRISISVKRNGSARQALGRAELRPFRNMPDAAPEVELDFKLYRQATNKIVGLTKATATFLNSYF